MKPFGQWFADFGKPAPAAPAEPDLPVGVSMRDGRYVVLCCVCGTEFEMGRDIADYPMDGDKEYCGGSPSCCP